MAKKDDAAFSPQVENDTTLHEMGIRNAGQLVGAGVIAGIMGLKKRTVLNMALRGQIPHVRLNTTTVRFDLVAINAWIDAQRVEARTPPEGPARAKAASGTTGEGDGAGKGGEGA